MALTLVAALGLVCGASGELRLNRMYGSHMVLQRGEPIRFSGFADAGRTVTVTFRGETRQAAVAAAGTWDVAFPAAEAGGPYEVTVTDGASVHTLRDVMVGDVWFCTGQSNMFWPLSQSGEPERELAAADHPDIRLLDVALTGCINDGAGLFEHRQEIGHDDRLGKQVFRRAIKIGTLPHPLLLFVFIVAAMAGPDEKMAA